MDPLTLSEKSCTPFEIYEERCKSPPGEETDIFFIGTESSHQLKTIKNNESIITALVKIKGIHYSEEKPKLSLTSHQAVENFMIMIPLPMTLVKQEKARLTKEENRLSYHIEKIGKQLSNEDFIKRAPQNLVAEHQDNMDKARKELHEIHRKLAEIEDSFKQDINTKL